MEPTLKQRCGQLVVGGFAGTGLPASFAESLRRGERGGAILFSRNVETPDQVAALNEAIVAAASEPPLLAVDQEGGAVARLGPPFLSLPPMRRLGDRDDPALTEQAGRTLGAQLAAFGFNVDFAPVVDVDSNPENPVIGARAFGREPERVGRHGAAFARGLAAGGVHACAKHFPGHGDTDLDSHFALPVVDRDVDALRAVELPPFVAAIEAGVAAMMTAHVVYPAYAEAVPATLSHRIATDLLRGELGFGGVLFTDDMLMAALDGDRVVAAVSAVAAGCDALLVCSDEELQDRIVEGLAAEARASEGFSARVDEAYGRVAAMRRARPPSVADIETRHAALDAPEARRIEKGLERDD